jgi:transcription termination factor Rho
VLVLAEADAARGELFREAATAAADAGARPWILLDDEAAEDLGEWERAVPDAMIVAPPSDQEPTDQIRAAELAVGQAKRRAEGGEDVLVIIDSLSRLAEGYRDPNRVRRLFGAGRELAEGETGSVTVIAAVVEDDERAEQTREILEGDESVQVRL